MGDPAPMPDLDPAPAPADPSAPADFRKPTQGAAAAPSAPPTKARRRSGWWWLLPPLALVGAAGWTLSRAPAFYAERVAAPREGRKQKSDQFLRDFVAFLNEGLMYGQPWQG